ncbi:hypothetical protein NB550_12125 [Vibrio parahaemolyticus]|uniref:hypothetical protein n=1 Tax=Vibrio TaxID=662 RepID=UPI00215C31C9|nr:hypothetical protein [Vibrio parahaemolyticus]MCR9888027.1 hypothetical protein [Vibrio parahaemolyticus]MCR9918241.1 hypothetical protein [Vibrio parahaemolyticus]
MNVQHILAEAPQRAVYWSPVVGQYFCREFRSFANRNVMIEQSERGDLVRLGSLKG